VPRLTALTTNLEHARLFAALDLLREPGEHWLDDPSSADAKAFTGLLLARLAGKYLDSLKAAANGGAKP
jgi:hypothetical protein